ncbi:MAG: ABC transporter ATP-binding protein [Thermoplasmata archaeon]|nr:ABC transporter ATP-binding protein [Thermoplasmata archaeon]MCI4344553.1 ABC transporter ATP-binding protein [Thermoplasmata archaeon]
MTQPSIETRELTKSFGSFTAVNNLTLKVEGAKCVGFLGPNGAGKTTTLKMLSDMIFPTRGEAFLNGESVQKNRKRALAYAGVLIESPEIYPALSPREALQMVADLRGLPRSEWSTRIDDALAEVKMSEWADAKFGKFSKGMKQRVNIAAALVHDPQIVILDEPSTGLDPRGMAEVRGIVRGLKRRSRLILMSSHILSEVTDVCDEVALIDRGKLLFYDTLSNVTARFAQGTASADAAFARPLPPELDAALYTVSGVTKVERLDPQRLRLTFTGGAETQARLVEELAQRRVGMLSFQESKSALEEVYLSQIAKGD